MSVRRIIAPLLLLVMGVLVLGMLVASWSLAPECRKNTGAWMPALAVEASLRPDRVEEAMAWCYRGDVDAAVREVDVDTLVVMPAYVVVLLIWRLRRRALDSPVAIGQAFLPLVAGAFDLFENAALRALLGAPYAWIQSGDLGFAIAGKWVALALATSSLGPTRLHLVVSACLFAVLPALALGAQGMSWVLAAHAVCWVVLGVVDLLDTIANAELRRGR